MERGTFVQIGLCIAAHFRDSLGAVIGVALIVVPIGTSCMANDLQHCCPGDRSGRFVPLVSKTASRTVDRWTDQRGTALHTLHKSISGWTD
jgi:hypothetical protein